MLNEISLLLKVLLYRRHLRRLTPTDIVRRAYFETVFISGEEIITGRDPTDPEKTKSVKYLYHNQQFSTFPTGTSATQSTSAAATYQSMVSITLCSRQGMGFTHYNEP